MPNDAARPLADRVVLITGAGAGIGAALAQAAAAAGAEVVLLGRTVAKLERVYDAIVDSGHPTPAIIPLDLEGAGPDDYRDLAERIREEWARLDALVHNAAHLGPQTPLEHYPPLEWYRALQVNLSGPLLLTQACLPLLRAADDPAVVFLDDPRASAYWGAYGVSKAGAATLAQMLGDELDTDNPVRVHRHQPPPTRTGLRGWAFPGERPDETSPPAAVVDPIVDVIGGR